MDGATDGGAMPEDVVVVAVEQGRLAMVVIVFGILLVAAGAVLFWGVDRTVSGVEVSTIGLILMAVGGVGILASLLLSARPTSGRGATTGQGRDSLSPPGVEVRQEEETHPFGRRRPQQPPWR
jgi:hypothetical protein